MGLGLNFGWTNRNQQNRKRKRGTLNERPFFIGLKSTARRLRRAAPKPNENNLPTRLIKGFQGIITNLVSVI